MTVAEMLIREYVIPAVTDRGVAIGFCAFIGISVAVVLGAIGFTSYKRNPLKVPKDYDNRWPGYPNRPGDPIYDSTKKGAMGNLLGQSLQYPMTGNDRGRPATWVDLPAAK